MSKFVLTAQLQLQAPTNVSQVVQQIQQQLQGVTVNIQAKGTAQAQKQIQQVAQAANQATTAAEKMGKAFALSVRRFAAFSIATRAVGLFTSTLGDAVQTAIDFERQLIKVAQVTGKSVGQLKGLTRQITDLSSGFGVASSDLLNVSTVLAQAGLSAEDTSVALKTLAKAALAPNFDSITETAEGAIAILAQFQQGVGALETQLGSINAVAGAFAVEASDLIDVVRRTGGVFKASGGSLNELLALFTSVRATTRESAESIGTGLRTIFTRIQRPKTIEFLKEFGVELLDLNGKFVGPYEAIRRLNQALAGLGEGDVTFIRIAEELGGFRQIGKVLPLIQQFSTAQSALNVAMKAGDSLTQDAASAQAALAIRVMKVKEEFLALVRSITETSTFQIMANTALTLASALIKIGDAIKPLLPMLAALAAFKIAKGLGGFFGGIMKGASSGRAYNQGGKVLKFARGGLVPGSGNRDTVPAMLSPGEFVIRKSSVNKMGAGNLAAMNENRYINGGQMTTAQKLAAARAEKKSENINKQKTKSYNDGQKNPIRFSVEDGNIGAFFMNPEGASDGLKSFKQQQFDLTNKKLLSLPGIVGKKVPRVDAQGRKLPKLSGESDKIIAKGILEQGNISTFYPSLSDVKSGSLSKIIESNVKQKLSEAVTNTASFISQNKLLDIPPIDANDNLLQAAAAQRIQNDTGAIKTTAGYLFEGVIDAITGAKPASANSIFDFPASSLQGNRSRLGALFGNASGIARLRQADAKASYSSKIIDGGPGSGSISSKIINSINSGNLAGIKIQTKNLGGIIQKFAAGGGVGTDTVPALLTPGEFVVNRSSAQRIGYGNLNRMNKVGKYAKGGTVQRFATGGGVKSGGAGLSTPGLDLKPSLLSRSVEALASALTSEAQLISQGQKSINFLHRAHSTLADALLENAYASGYTVDQEARLYKIYDKVIQSALRMGMTNDQFNAKAMELVAALDADTKAKLASATASTATAASSSSTPASSAAAATAATKIIGKAPGDSAAAAANTTDSIVGKLSPKDAALVKDAMKKNTDAFDKVTKEMQDMLYMEEEVQAGYKALARALRSGVSAEEAHRQALAAADSSLNQRGGSSFVKAIREGEEGAIIEDAKARSKTGQYKSENGPLGRTFANEREKNVAVLENQAKKGQVKSQDLGKALVSGDLTQAQAKAIAATNAQAVASQKAAESNTKATAATNTQAVASQKAAQSNINESSASDKAAASDLKEASGGSMGAKGMDFSNLAMGLSLVSGTIQGMLPPLDENSSLLTKMSHGILGAITTISGLVFAMSAFGITVNSSTIAAAASAAASFLFGGASTMATAGMTAAAAACTTLAGSAAMAAAGNASTGVMAVLAATGLAGVAASAFAAASALITAIAPIVAGIAAIVAPLLVIAGTAYIVTKAFNFMIGAFYDKSKELKKATEEGKVSEASSLAGQQYDLEVGNTLRGVGATIGAYFGGPFGAIIGAAVAPLAGQLLDYIAPGFTEGINILFGGNTRASAVALAAAQAGAVKTQKSLDEAQKIATTAMSDFEKGTISASEALAKIRAKSNEAKEQMNRASSFASENDKNRSTGALSYGREAMAYLSLGYVDSAKERNDKLSAQNVEQINNAAKQQQEAFNLESPARQAAIRSGVARGKSKEEIRKEATNGLQQQISQQRLLGNQLQSSGDEAGAKAAFAAAEQMELQLKQVNKEIENIEKEVQRAKDSFEAMNLGLRSATATSTALSAGMSRFSAGLEVGGSTFVDDVEFLQQSLSSAAQAMDPSDIKDAMKNVSANLSEFGVSPEYIKKFEGNVSAFTQAQANYNKAFENVKKSIADADFKNLSADQLKAKMADELTKGMGPDVSDEAKKNLKAVIANMELSDADVNKIIGGDLSAFGDKLTEEQKKMFEDVQKIAQERAKAEQVLIDFTKRRIDAERNLVEAQKEALDLVMEGRDIEAKYGGQAVTAEERRSNLLAKSNVEGSRLGLTNMTTGDAGELRRRNAEIRQSFANIEDKRSQRGGLQGKRGVEADETQKDLQKAYKTQIETIRGLIKLEEDQLKITQEKNKLEKESMESLVKGDVEEFFKKQSAVGATAAIASGDERLMRLYGADALGTAAMDIQRQQDAGVQELYGQQLAGAGGLTEAAAGAALSARGVTDMRAAQVMAGTTAEEEASKARLRELGGMLGETGQLGSEMAEMQVQTATINVNSAELKFNETMNRGKEAAKEANRAENMPAVAKARGGLIYANRGIFVPRGTDTVPAMLTPGEFVVNRSAVQRGNNLQILQAMNGGAGVSNTSGGSAAMSTGGRVRYFSDGGETGGAGGGGGMFDNISKFISAMSTFSTNLSSNIEKLTNTSLSIKLDATNVNVNINDGGLLSKIKDETKAELFKKIQNELVAGEGGRLIENRMR